ncbi:MAG: hypothetical protein LIO93_09395 [Bacteroidales bacterium]|nr:hypothetical protein [Bacteroidales bacterium]
MSLKEKIEQLASEKNDPSVTISLNTHRTHPDSLKDEIVLKNLLNEAEKRVIENYGKRPVAKLLENIEDMKDKIDVNYLLDSLHIFLSNNTKEFFKLTWPTPEDRVLIDDTFDVNALIKSYNRCEEYLILVLSQGGTLVFKAMNDQIVEEIKNDDFPFEENPYYIPDREDRTDAELVDNMIRQYYNEVDKAAQKVCQEYNLKCIVASVEENYSMLLQVADKPDIYIGHTPINYNKLEPHNIVKSTWEIIKQQLMEERAEAIQEAKDAIANARVTSDLLEIYQAAIDGRGDLLIVYEGFSQPVKMIDDRTFEYANDPTSPSVINDITGTIVWKVMSQGGRVYFTQQDSIKKLGEIVLKLRY